MPSGRKRDCVIGNSKSAHPLRLYREIKGLSRPQLERLSGVPTTYLTDIELRDLYPTPRYIDALERALGIDPGVLALGFYRHYLATK